VNYAVKSSLLLSFLESVPGVDTKLKAPKSLQTATPKFEDVVKEAQAATVLWFINHEIHELHENGLDEASFV
jgi:hypothetical protein